jgi:aminoglycoside phosphotransferase (APT) family kinase protein
MLGRQRDVGSMHAALTAWLRTKRPGEDVVLSPLATPKAGISNETFLVDATSGTSVQRLVVRVEPTDFLVFPEYDLGRQARVCSASPAARCRCRACSGSRRTRTTWARRST